MYKKWQNTSTECKDRTINCTERDTKCSKTAKTVQKTKNLPLNVCSFFDRVDPGTFVSKDFTEQNQKSAYNRQSRLSKEKYDFVTGLIHSRHFDFVTTKLRWSKQEGTHDHIIVEIQIIFY